MPPNRKGAFDAVDNLATLQLSQFVDRAKFQPLTAEKPATESREPEIAVHAPREEKREYEKKAIIDRILLEEKLREQFSADHIIRANQHKVHEKDGLHHEATDSDDYWAMTTSSKDVSNVIQAKQTDSSYWDWQTKTKEESKEEVIQAILEQERIRQLFTADHVVKNMKKGAAALQKKKILDSQNDGYWAWDVEVSKSDSEVPVNKEEVIQKILEEERVREQLFSIAAVEAKLMKERREEGVSCHARILAPMTTGLVSNHLYQLWLCRIIDFESDAFDINVKMKLSWL